MDKQNHTKHDVARFLKEMLRDATPVNNPREPYQMMGRIRTPEDIGTAINETFTALEALKKRKGKFDDRRIWSFFFFALMIAGVVTIKSLIATGIFLFGTIVATLVFSKAHKAVSPLEIEIKAYDRVLQKLYEMQIMYERTGKTW